MTDTLSPPLGKFYRSTPDSLSKAPEIVQLYDPEGMAAEARVLDAAERWAAARQAVLAEETPDVRTSESFRVRLDALATAEAALVAAVKSRKETE